jgi:DNA repair exonuclease SbcCD ATPase subunit
MRQIVLRSLYLHNFKSFSSPTEIALPATAGLKFLGGKNLTQPRLGSNGAGKSTLWDALCWCLFGSGVRGQKASDLATWGEKQPHVIVQLDIDGQTYSIDRRGSPNRLTIDTATATQEDVERLVGLGRDRFLHSVVFGQGVPQFLDITPAARGELLDSVLNLGYWLELSDAADDQARDLKHQLVELEANLAYERGHLDGLQDATKVQEAFDSWEQTRQQLLETKLAELDREEHEATDIQRHLDRLLAEVLPSPDGLTAEIDQIQDRLREANQARRQADFYRDHDCCPTCQHPLEPAFIERMMGDLDMQIDSLLNGLSLNETHAKLAERHAELEALGKRSLLWNMEQVRLRSEAKFTQDRIRALERRVEEIGEEANPHRQNLEELKAQRRALTETIGRLEAGKFTFESKLQHAEYWKVAFKRVRLYVVKQVLLRLEVETANAAFSLGIRDWRIRYVTEVETKSGSMRPGIQVLVSTGAYSGSWEGFSGGETQRVRLAVTQALASLIQGLAAVSWGIEVWDEASAYLSGEGIEDLLNCLAHRAEQAQKAVWVSDHTQLSFAAFSEVWHCVKTHEGSKVELVTPTN